jgi:ribosomal protein S18 acetylase RimI-like enzyme
MESEPTHISFLRLEQYASRRFRQAMRIYRDEFSASSRLSIARVCQLLRTGSYQLFIAQENEEVLGFALVWKCPRPVFVHLDYIAVRQDRKGHGLGTALYRWLITHLKDFAPRAYLFTLEVEEDLIAFYRRSQTYLLADVPYLFPGPRGPIPMHLMVYDRQKRAVLARKTVQGIIRALYQGLHNRQADDALLRSFISCIPQQISLE